MLLKKVKVLFLYPDSGGAVGSKTFTTKKHELKVYNTDAGYLVLEDWAKDRGKNHKATIGREWETLAVFKEWIYWEKVEDENQDDEYEPDRDV